MDEIIKEYNKEHINQIDYNKNDLECLLEKKYESCKEKDYLKKQLFLFFIMQIFTANDDFHMGNIEMLHGPNLYFSPFFDFNRCGKIRLKNEIFYKFPYNKGEYNAKQQLKSFIKEATNEELETFKFYLEQLKRIEWRSFFETREEQMHAKIPWIYKLNLKREFINNLKEVENISRKN